MKKYCFVWWLTLIAVVFTSIVNLCSCTAGITIGKSNRIEQTVTNSVDSTISTFSINPLK